MQQTEKYWNLINRIVLVAIFIMAGFGIVLAFTPKVRQMQDYQKKRDSLQQRLDAEIDLENEYILKRRRMATDRDFVERIAHEVGYAHKGEVIFHFPEEAQGH